MQLSDPDLLQTAEPFLYSYRIALIIVLIIAACPAFAGFAAGSRCFSFAACLAMSDAAFLASARVSNFIIYGGILWHLLRLLHHNHLTSTTLATALLSESDVDHAYE
jgi:hypothetical protein